MACRYTYQGKTYEAVEFDDVLRAMRPETAAQYMPTVKSIPSAPFVTSTDKWLTLALKRVITMAAQEGYDKVAFVNGEQSAERYDLSKQVDYIDYRKRGDDSYDVAVIATDGRTEVFAENGIGLSRIEDVVGKEVAQKIADGVGQKGRGSNVVTLRGLDLKVGGEGMRAFYDKIVPTAANKLLAKLGGGKVEVVKLPGEGAFDKFDGIENGAVVWTFDSRYAAEKWSQAAPGRKFRPASADGLTQPGFTITTAMREKASAGLPLFKRPGPTASGMPLAQAQSAVDAITKKWGSGPDVRVVQSYKDLPFAAPSDVKGAYYRGVAYIVAGRHRNKQEVGRTIAHEIIAHHGLRELLGREKWAQLMNQVQLAIRTGNKPLKALQETVRERYRNDDGSYTLSAKVEADEIIALGIESAIDADGNFKPGFGMFKALFARLAQFLRENGISIQFTNTELQGMLVLAQRNLEAGSRAQGGREMVIAAARGTNDGAPLLESYTPAEAVAKAEAEEAARQAAEKQAPRAPGKKVTADQVDLFNSQGGLFMRGSDVIAEAEMLGRRVLMLEDDVGDATRELNKLIEYGKRQKDKVMVAERIAEQEQTIADIEKALTKARRDLAKAEKEVAAIKPLDDPRNQQSLFSRDNTRTPQTETKAFKDWFGDSVVTESGEAGGSPKVVYHGTKADFTEFKRTKGGEFGPAIYMTDSPREASEYGDGQGWGGPSGTRIMPLYASIKNPYTKGVDAFWKEFGTGRTDAEGVAAAKAAGYDGIIAKRADRYYDNEAREFVDRGDELTHYIAFNPEQVKSATGNNGNFDPKDPDIRFSRTNTAQTEDADPTPPELSPWRDATGRLQFAPGAWLWDKLGTASGPILNKLQLKAATPELRRIMRQMKLDVAKAQEVAAAVAGEATKLTEDERAMVSDLIEKELKAGTVPPEHAVRLAAMINSSMEQQTNELVRLGMLTKDSADRWRGQYLPRYYESKLTEKAGDLWADAMRSITRRPSAMKGIKGKHLRGRGLYETIPESQLEDYKTMGWEVRDPDYQPGVTTDGTVQVWRDFTRQERDKMGEIRDAGFRFVMGYMQTQKDIALGKMFEQLAIDPEMSSRLETEKFSVRVPDGKAPGTEVKTYGKLAGRYVTPETLSQLSLIEESQSEALMMYRKALGIWKEGKALALDTPIPTPSGWTTMGALQPGDQVFDEKGRPCEVTFATPVQMDRECFEVEFSDGCKIVADAEHLWLTKYHGVESVKTTKRILETLKYAGGQYNAHSVPVAGPLTLPDQTLPIDPYYLGVWLGNGTARNTAITSCQADGEVIMGFLRDRGLGIGAVRKDPRGDCITYSVGFDGYRPRRELLQPTMRALNLLQNKHIPAIYLRASEQQRLDLLCGLMDTDGTISERGQLEFCTTTEALKDGIVELARSLGFKPRARKQTAAGNNQVSWLVKFHGYDDRPVFALPRKIARLRKAPETRQRSSTRQIVAITPVASVPVKCIQVSSESRLYLAGEGMIPTHNTVLNPVSHVNNTISNMSMAHFAGVSYGRADKYLAAMRDFAKKSPMILEAKDNGLFLGTLSEAELMNTLPEDLKALAQKQEGAAEKVGRTTFNLMTFYLRRPMGWAYQAEDTFFRYLIYKDARERGMEPQDAVDYAQRYIFTYDDLPKTARRIRDFGIPFFAYTYKAVPALLHTALTHPERLAAPAAVLWTINAAAYAIAAGDDEDDWDVKLRRYLTDPEYREKARAKEKLERELLPEWNKGTTSLMTPKVIRLGNDELTKLPMFIDVSRIIPGGDLFDVNPNAGGIGLPQPITPSHPLFTTAVAMLANKDLFFGKDLTDSNDTAGEKFDKRAAWMWKQLTPAIAVNNYHFERGMNALAQASGGEVTWLPEFVSKNYTGVGRDGLPVQPKLAALQTFGIKIRPYDLDKAEQIQEGMRNKLIREIDAEMRSLRRLNNLGAVSDQSYEKAKELSSTKKDRVREGKSVDGEDLR